MSYFAKFFAFFLLYCSVLGLSVHADELTDREELRNKVQTLYVSKKYDELDDLATRLRKDQSRTSSGVWKLTIFYSSLSGLVRANQKAEYYWKSWLGTARGWMRFRPDSIAAKINYAAYLRQYAWSIRGETYAKDVPEYAWADFKKYNLEALQVLQDSKELTSSDPHWYALAISIMLGLDRDDAEFYRLFEEASSKFPYYYETYFKAALYLTPKWRGSAEALKRLAATAVQLTSDKDGASMYARIYWAISGITDRSYLFGELEADWDSIREGFESVLERYPDQWNIRHFAYYACLAGDIESILNATARLDEATLRLGDDVTTTVKRCKSWAESEGAGGDVVNVGRQKSGKSDLGI